MQENKQEKSSIKQKILLYISQKGISKYEFYKNSGITRGILTQNNGITEENLMRFLAYATDINLEWLFFGEGEMCKTNRIPGCVCVTPADGEPSHDNKDIQKNPEKQDNSAIISQLLDTIREQAEEIGQLKALVAELERRIRAAEDTHTTAAAG